MASDPYAFLGVPPSATDTELRDAYRRLVQRHHPDHNGGSAESAVRFAEVQEAYARVKLLRHSAERPAAGRTDDALEARIAEMEADLRRAHTEREQATRRAERVARIQRTVRGRTPSAPDGPRRADHRPSPEELGYVSTDDSFAKILDDAADGIAGQLTDARRAAAAQAARAARAHAPAPAEPDPAEPDPAPRRRSPPAATPRSISQWIDELSSRLTGEDR